MTKTVVK